MNRVLWVIVAVLGCSSAALPSTITFIGAGTSTGGDTVDASATLVTGAGTITVTLNNLLSNPKTVAQNLTDLIFTLSNGANTGTLTSSTGTELTVNSDATYSVGSSVATGWALNSMGGSLLLEVLGTPEAPAHTIIGTSSNGTYSGGTYSNANGSIAGNGPHNPFLESGATFTLTVPGVTATTTVTAATFSFNTTAGDTLVGTPVTVPEPTPLLLLGAGLLAIGMLRVRHRAGQTSRTDQ